MSDAPLRVLVVDDDEEDFLILRDLLADYAQARFHLDWVGTLREGIAALRANDHDVFLVDYQLGPDNGMELVRLAVAEGSAHRPVIMLTGQGNPDVDREALAAGASDYLVKGAIDAEKLARSLRYAAERARQIAEIEDGKRRYQLLFALNPYPTWVYDCETMRFVAVNDATVAGYGYTRDELLAMTVLDIRAPEEAERLKAFLAGWGDNIGNAGIWQHLRKDGSRVWVDITTHNLVLDGRDCRMVIAHDITTERVTRERLQLLERAVESSINGVVIADANAPDLPVIYVNPAFESMTGYSASEILGRNCRFLQGTLRDQPELEVLRAALRTQSDCNVILSNQRKDGSLFWNHLFLSPVRDDQGRVTHFVGVQNDLTERRQVEAELAFTANHDAVTGLPRFPILETALASLLEKEGSVVSLFYIDLDHFHSINESMGHVIGDEALRLVAERLSAVMGGPAFPGAFRRRRIRGDRGRRRPGAGGRTGARHPHRPGAADRGRRLPPVSHRQHRHQPFARTRRKRHGTAAPRRGRHDPGQAPGSRRGLRILGRADAGTGRPAGAGCAPARRHRPQRAEPELPAAAARRRPPHHRFRGPGALEQPGPGPGAAGTFHPDRRSPGPDARSRQLGDERSLPAASRLAGPGS